MLVLGFWLFSGVAIGMILMAFLAIGSFRRGYERGYSLRRPWHVELGARRTAALKVRARVMRPAPLHIASSHADRPPRTSASVG